MSGIGRRISESIDKFDHKDYENALIQVIIAIDATAKNEFPELSGSGNVGKRCKQFIESNTNILALAMTHSLECEIVLGNMPLEDVIYHVVRTNILHEAELPASIKITEDIEISYLNNKITVPYTVLPALILCVVGSPTNSSERIDNIAILKIYEGVSINVNEFFGKKDEIMQVMRRAFTRWLRKKKPGKIILSDGSLVVE